ncbi:MAG: ankyrin repeat domain-containing protein [Chloroflexota bacterium]
MTTDFFTAIKKGDFGEVKKRLESDPGLIHAREKSLSPVLVAVYHRKAEMAEYLAGKAVILTIFEAAALGKTTHVIRLLAHQPELVNAYADDGFQPLGLACFFGQFETAEYLIKAGAMVNSPSRNGLNVTPLQSAAAGGHLEIVQLLLKNGANPNVRETGGFTPLHAASENGDVEMIHALILAGADLHAKSADGRLPLDLAQANDHKEAIKVLKAEITKRFRAPL